MMPSNPLRKRVSQSKAAKSHEIPFRQREVHQFLLNKRTNTIGAKVLNS
jgi:hypothetical protein